MGQKNTRIPNHNFKVEYQQFTQAYLLPLLGFVDKMVTIMEVPEKVDSNNPLVEVVDRMVYFSINEWRLLELQLDHSETITSDNLKLARRIIESFIGISENKRTGSGKQNYATPLDGDKLSNPKEWGLYRKAQYEFAIQDGICSWIIDHSNNEEMKRLFDCLETWSVKTYEGRKVSFGFVVNLDAVSAFDASYGNWLDFLQDDFSAVLTDSIHSVIEINNHCEFVKYISISEEKELPRCDLSYDIPLRFTQIINRYVRGPGVSGIFLLNNGDIILAREGQVRFVKRNRKWLNFSFEAFYNALEQFRNRYTIDESLLKSIYASVLDVSFSHTGGIIAVVDNPWSGTEKPYEDNVLNACDDLLNGKSCNELYTIETERSEVGRRRLKENEINKKLLKRNVVQMLVRDKVFSDIDRKLRGELISMDGACILKLDGRVHSFGAIIQYDSGSSGGGRKAAATKLSSYGMAVKISTDGYVELYVNQQLVYSIS